MVAIVLHHILRAVDFHPVEFNLRESFRVLADNRERGDVLELPGISIASLGVKFQMFNAAFLNAPVESAEELDERLRTAAGHFRSRALRWSLWICEDWLTPPVRRVLSQRCEKISLRLCADMPGMSAKQLKIAKRDPPQLEYVSVDSTRTLEDFRGIGSLCFHVPMDWFAEVFENQMPATRPRFRCYVAYLDGVPVATAAAVRTGSVLGIYNVATAPGHRRRGIAEAVTRYLIRNSEEMDSVVLQSTAHGFRLYERIGFRSVTRILVYNSMP